MTHLFLNTLHQCFYWSTVNLLVKVEQRWTVQEKAIFEHCWHPDSVIFYKLLLQKCRWIYKSFKAASHVTSMVFVFMRKTWKWVRKLSSVANCSFHVENVMKWAPGWFLGLWAKWVGECACMIGGLSRGPRLPTGLIQPWYNVIMNDGNDRNVGRSYENKTRLQ